MFEMETALFSFILMVNGKCLLVLGLRRAKAKHSTHVNRKQEKLVQEGIYCTRLLLWSI